MLIFWKKVPDLIWFGYNFNVPDFIWFGHNINVSDLTDLVTTLMYLMVLNVKWFDLICDIDSHGTHSNHVTSSKWVNTLICHTTMCRNAINFLYNIDHVTLWCLEVLPVVYARVLWWGSSYKINHMPKTTHHSETSLWLI